jgi:hypothetical protein
MLPNVRRAIGFVPYLVGGCACNLRATKEMTVLIFVSARFHLALSEKVKNRLK